jgi:glycosyltransferase involved in cell wall biosynthesis
MPVLQKTGPVDFSLSLCFLYHSQGINPKHFLSDPSSEQAMNHRRCAIVIPAYNHGRQLRDVLAETLQFGFPVVVVDDGSTDSTPQILASFSQVTVLRHDMNQGKGASLLDGFSLALKVADYAITMDADGQHNPDDIPSLVRAVPPGARPLVIGKRSGMEQANAPWTSRWGRKFSNFWVWASCGEWISDSQSGFRLYPLPETLRLGATSRRFQFEVEILVRTVWSGIPIQEVPVQALYGPAGDRISHFRPFADFMRNFSVFTKLILMRAFLTFSIHKKR